MTDFIYKLASAMATAEGWFSTNPDVIPRRFNNPGNLRAAPWVNGAKIEKGYWHAESPEQGIAGLYHQIALDIARGRTLRGLIEKWAPSKDGNNTELYLTETARRLGLQLDPITKDTPPLWNFLGLGRIP